MSKIVVLGDFHYGVRNNNQFFYDYFKSFLDDILFPYLEINDIKYIIHLGDLFDHRKYINFITLERIQKDFLQPLKNKNIKMDVLVGNHDSYYKDNIKTNSLNLLLSSYDNIKVIDKPTTEGDICFIPWICEDNFDYVQQELEYTSAKTVFGHLELNGYEMMPGHVCTHGHDPNMFKKFNAVYSGHFHKKTGHGNIMYLGTPWQMTWADYGQKKGFHVFDTETEELEFIENPYEMFIRFDYNDKNLKIDIIEELDFSIFKDKYVKVVVIEKNNPILFDMILEKIEEVGPIKLQTLEETILIDLESEKISDNVEDTPSILSAYIDKIELETSSKDSLKTIMVEIYNTALNYQAG